MMENTKILFNNFNLHRKKKTQHSEIFSLSVSCAALSLKWMDELSVEGFFIIIIAIHRVFVFTSCARARTKRCGEESFFMLLIDTRTSEERDESVESGNSIFARRQ